MEANSITPMTHSIRYVNAVRFPSVFVPSAAIITGSAAPIEIPIRIGSALSNTIAPVTDRACTIPTAADAD